MLKALVALVLGTPLIGIWLIERGEFAVSIGISGHSNGATVAYLSYAGLLIAVAWLTARTGRAWRPAASAGQLTLGAAIESERRFSEFARRLLFVNLLALAVMLFGFGGLSVWAGELDKGEFRVTLGPLGALAYLMTKFAGPALLAYAALLYRGCRRHVKPTLLLLANAGLAYLVGATWGFKTSGVFMLLPALLLLNWRLPIRRLLGLGVAVALLLVLSTWWFDASLIDDGELIAFLLTRLTILQGDVSWYLWDLYRQGEQFPDYSPTLLAAFGDSFLSLAGVERSDLEQWMRFHYDWTLTHLSGVPLENIAAGHTVTAAPFSEGLIAGGAGGIACFAVLAGVLVGVMHRVIQRALDRARDVQAVLAATYFSLQVLPWLNGGAITQLFHVSVWLYVLVTWASLVLLRPGCRQLRRAQAGRLALAP